MSAGDGGGHALDHCLAQGAQHAAPGLLPIGAPHDHLGHQVVEELADGVALLIAGIGAHAVAVGAAEPGDGARRRQEPAAGRVLGVDAHLDGVAAAFDLFLAEPQRLPRRHRQLQRHQVQAGDQLGHRVFHLEAGVHLQEVEQALGVQELDRSGTDVAAAPGGGHRGFAHRHLDRIGDVGGRGLLDQLLVTALGRAVTGAQRHAVAMGIGEHLHLDVARPRQVTLQVGLGPAERLVGLALGRLERGGCLVGRVDDPHAPPTSAVGGLDGDRPAVPAAEGDDLVGGDGDLGRAGHHLHVGPLRRQPGADLVTHDLDGVGRRADEGDAGRGDCPGEGGVLGQEAVAGVDAIGPRASDDIEDLVDVEVGLARGVAVQRICLVGQPHVQRVPVESRIDGDGGNPQVAAGAHDPDRDLTPIGDKHLGEHSPAVCQA